MSNQSLYPTQRQKALYTHADYDIKQYHKLANGSAWFFRRMFGLTMSLYLVIMSAGGFEVLTQILTKEGSYWNNQVLSIPHALVITILSAVFALMINQVVLVLGHGYRHKEAQLFVDRISGYDDCTANISIMRSMYIFAGILSVAFLWIAWGGYGTPFYKEGLFGEQLVAFKATLEPIFTSQPDFYDKAVPAKVATNLKPFLWLTTVALLACTSCALLGWLQATLSRMKMLKYKKDEPAILSMYE